MNKLTRKQVSLVFKTRTRMMKVKGNYKNGYPDLICRACKNAEETQNHTLSDCKALHPYGPPTRNEMEPFSDDINVLKETARTVEEIEKRLNTSSTGEGQVNPGEARANLPVSTTPRNEGTGM